MNWQPETRRVVRKRTCIAIDLPRVARPERLLTRWADTLGGPVPEPGSYARLEAECARREGIDWDRQMAAVREQCAWAL